MSRVAKVKFVDCESSIAKSLDLIGAGGAVEKGEIASSLRSSQ